MPQKKDNLPVKVDVELQNGGTITYANEVIATIAGVAANEIDGIAGMCISGGFGDILSRNRNITRGVKVEVGSQEAAVDLYIIVEYGKPIQRVAAEVQENVRKALESLTGLHVVRVDVHVQGVSFEREKRAAQSSIEAAKQQVLTEAAPEKKAEPEEKAPAAQEAEAEAAAKTEKTEESPAAQEAAAEEAAEELAAEEAAEADPQVLAEEAAVDGAEDASCCEAEKADEGCQAEAAECAEQQDQPVEEAGEDAPVLEKKPAKRPGGRKRS